MLCLQLAVRELSRLARILFFECLIRIVFILTTNVLKLVVCKVADNHSPFCCCKTGFVANDRVIVSRAAETELVTKDEYEFLQDN